MKIKPIHFVPFYGGYKFFKEYFGLHTPSINDRKAAHAIFQINYAAGVSLFLPLIIFTLSTLHLL